MRINWLDSFKGMLIMLVVVGHVVGGSYHFCSGNSRDILELLYKVIYEFHMPAFFVLAGITWKIRNENMIDFMSRKGLRLLLPYAVFGLASVFVYVIMSGAIGVVFGGANESVYGGKGREIWWMPFVSLLHAGGWPNGNGFQANSTLWFLPCLFSLQIVAFLLDKIGINKKGMIVIALFLVFLDVVTVRFNKSWIPFGLSLVPKFYIYYVLGRIIPWNQLVDKMRINGFLIFVLLALTFSIYVVISYLLPNRWYGDWWLHWRLVFMGMALLGTFMCMICASLSKHSKLLGLVGVNSLVIMLLHKFPVLGLQLLLPPLREAYRVGGLILVPIILVVSLFAILCSIIVAFVARKYAPWMIGEFK